MVCSQAHIGLLVAAPFLLAAARDFFGGGDGGGGGGGEDADDRRGRPRRSPFSTPTKRALRVGPGNSNCSASHELLVVKVRGV
jgi:hypothetical protein